MPDTELIALAGNLTLRKVGKLQFHDNLFPAEVAVPPHLNLHLKSPIKVAVQNSRAICKQLSRYRQVQYPTASLHLQLHALH